MPLHTRSIVAIASTGLVLALGGCSRSVRESDAGNIATPVESGAAFDSTYAAFADAYRAADADAVARLYAEDAFYLKPGGDAVRGRDAIREIFAGFLDPFAERGEVGPAISFRILDRSISGDLAYDIGYFTLGEGDPSGKFIVIWKRGADGVWRIHADGYNGLQP